MKKESYIILDFSDYPSSWVTKKIGFKNFGAVFYIKEDDLEQLVVANFDEPYYRQFSKIEKINQIPKNGDMLSSIIAYLRKKGKKVYISSSFPLVIYQKLVEEKIKTEVNNALFVHDVVIKTPAEIEIIKENAETIKKVFAFVEQVLGKAKIEKGRLYYKNRKLTSYGLIGIISEKLSENNFKLDFPIVASGPFSAFPHCSIEHDILPFRPIVIDLTCSHIFDGYYTDVTRTYFKGSPSKEFNKLFQDVMAAKKLIKKLAIDSATINDVFMSVEKNMNENGINFDKDNIDASISCFHTLGHGVGQKIHEPPTINKDSKLPLKNNMVIAMEPAAYIVGRGGVRIEDTYWITDKKCVNMTGNDRYNHIIK